MSFNVKTTGYATLAGATGLFAVGYFVPPSFWQNAIVGIASTLLGLGLAVLVVNSFLMSHDKKAAAKPLLQMIAPTVRELHNELFLDLGYDKFGKDKFHSMMDLYKKHKGDPECFAPEDRTALYQSLEENRSELNRTYSLLAEQFREMTLMLGWSFDAQITQVAMSARLTFSQFQVLKWDSSKQDQLDAVEAFFDADVMSNQLFSVLATYLGLSKTDYLSDNPNEP